MFWEVIRTVIKSEINDIMKLYRLGWCHFCFDLKEIKKIRRSQLKERVIDWVAEKILDLKELPLNPLVAGYTNYKTKQILINFNLSEVSMNITFIHEILHIILKERKLIFLCKFIYLYF